MIHKRLFVLVMLLLTACSGLGQTPPPPPHSVESMATAIHLTENAPPTGYEMMAFPRLDAGLDELAGYRYVIELRFQGVYDSTLQETSGVIRAEVWGDGLTPARRVRLDAEGLVFASEPRDLEAVRIVDAHYLVNEDGRCLLNVEDTAQGVANLSVHDLLGGVEQAPYSGIQAILNSEQSYRYNIDSDAVTLPFIHQNEGSVVTASGELWVAPQYDAVTRYYVNVDVSRVTLLDGEQSVSGQIFVRYDLYEIGTVPNISIPFGC
ncbi:MAG: hypothetical protein JXN59_12390 [Anaerolineae bacterium]|nr:hypothetical protein [Anaerolineae bacterium]